MVNYICLASGIVILILGIILLFTDVGSELFSPHDEMVNIDFYFQFVPYTLFIAGIILIVRAFMREK